jgi:hypothetical protein
MDPDPHAALDFTQSAELFSGRTREHGVGYRRFVSLEAAVAFSIEMLPAQQLNTVAIETRDTRYAAREIRALYDRPDFPGRGRAQ